MSSLYESGILDSIPGKLGERLAEFGDTLRLHLEMTLLSKTSIPAMTQLEVSARVSTEIRTHSMH